MMATSQTSPVALVTGVASGIGAAVCKILRAEGYRIAALDANAEALSAWQAALPEGPQMLARAIDVRDEEALTAFVAEAEAELGPITAAVPCAGLTRSAPAESMTKEAWDLVIDVNLTGTFLTCKAVAAPMLKRGRGSIVCIGSISAKGGQPGRANYAASKFAVLGLVKSLALEWGGRGVRVNAVSPGVVATPMVIERVPKHFQEVMFDRIPMKRFAEPEDIASAILLLLSDHASYINGAALEVDGGITAGFLTSRHGEDYATAEPPQRIEPEEEA